jgi:hypothetical protein
MGEVPQRYGTESILPRPADSETVPAHGAKKMFINTAVCTFPVFFIAGYFCLTDVLIKAILICSVLILWG